MEAILALILVILSVIFMRVILFFAFHNSIEEQSDDNHEELIRQFLKDK